MTTEHANYHPMLGLRFRRRQFLFAVSLVVSLSSTFTGSWAQSARAQKVINQKAKFEAAYLVLFTKYITWPAAAFAGPNDPFVFGILGKHEVESHLKKVEQAHREIANRKMVVRRFAQLDKVGKCHILFVPATAGADTERAVARKLQGKPVLIVGESNTLLQQGGTAKFSVAANKLTITIKNAAAQQAGLQGISKLSRVAEIR